MFVYAQPGLPEQGTFSDSRYVEYLQGDIPLIISVPHDGEKSPDFIPNRDGEDMKTRNDAGTQDLGWAIRKALYELTGKTPYVIINHMRRRKVDVNREIEEAAAGNKLAETVWEEYHSFIDSAKESVYSEFKKGMYIDLHAHNHTAQFLELGYLLEDVELQLEDTDLNDDLFNQKTSIRNLVITNPNKYTFPELLRGKYSLGSLLDEAGYPAIPSMAHPNAEGRPFFQGGYSLNRHGSMSGGTIDGIQIETNSRNVRDSGEDIRTFSKAFTNVMIQYLDVHYKFHITKRQSQPGQSAE